MSELKYDPELPFVVRVRFSEELLGRFSDLQDAEQIAASVYGGYDTEVIDTTPKPKIPDDAEFIIWRSDPSSALQFAEKTQDFWAIEAVEVSDEELISEIGDAEVTVLVRKEDS